MLLSWAAALVLILAVCGYLVTQTDLARQTTLNDQAKSSSNEDTERSVNNVDYSGPSQSDIDSSQDGKKNSEELQLTTGKNVDVAISFADVFNGNVEVRAFIPGLIEASGICTANLKQGNITVDASANAFIDVSSTQCPPIYIPLSRFPATGKWTLTVMYTSTVNSGSSGPIEVIL